MQELGQIRGRNTKGETMWTLRFYDELRTRAVPLAPAVGDATEKPRRSTRAAGRARGESKARGSGRVPSRGRAGAGKGGGRGQSRAASRVRGGDDISLKEVKKRN